MMKKHSRGYISDAVELFLAVFILAVLFVGIPALIVWTESYKCHLQADKLQLESDWGFIQGCLVKFDETRWVDIDRIRINENGALGVGAGED